MVVDVIEKQLSLAEHSHLLVLYVNLKHYSILNAYLDNHPWSNRPREVSKFCHIEQVLHDHGSDSEEEVRR